jgi:hypothetical protein
MYRNPLPAAGRITAPYAYAVVAAHVVPNEFAVVTVSVLVPSVLPPAT